MNDRQRQITAYAALAFSFVVAVSTAVMIVDRLAYMI